MRHYASKVMCEGNELRISATKTLSSNHLNLLVALVARTDQMTVSQHEFESAIHEFYTCADHQLRQRIHADLIKLRSTPVAWELSLTALQNQGKSPTVQLFAVQTLNEKLTNGWEEYGTDMEKVSQLQSMVLSIAESPSLSTLIRHHMCSCVATLVLQTMPDIWEQPIADCINRWRVGNAVLLFGVLAELPVQFSKWRAVVDRRNNVRSELLTATQAVSDLVQAELAQPNNHSNTTLLAVIKCVNNWCCHFSSAQLGDWLPALAACFNLADNPNCIGALASLLSDLSEHEQLSKHPTLVRELATFVDTRLCPKIVESVLNNDANGEDADIESLLVAIITLVEENAQLWIRLILDEQHEHARHILDVLTHITCLPGVYPIDQRWCSIPLRMWSLIEQSFPPDYEPNSTKPPVPVFTELYTQVFIAVVGKCALPSIDPARGPTNTDWDAEAVELHQNYRSSAESVLVACWRVLGSRCVEMISTALQSSAANAVQHEAALFACLSVSDEIFADNPLIRQILTNLLPSNSCLLQPTGDWLKVALTASKLIGQLVGSIVESDHALTLFPTCVRLCLQWVGCEQLISSAALFSVKLLLMETTKENILPLTDPITDVCYTCFLERTELPTVDRLRALECVGMALSVNQVQLAAEKMNQILAPRLQSVHLAANGQLEMDKSQLMFEIDVVSTCLSSVQMPNSGNTDTTWLWNLSIDLLPLLQQIVQLSGRDREIGVKVCACLKQMLLAAHKCEETPESLGHLRQLMELVTTMVPDVPSAFDVAKQTFIQFGHSSVLASLLTSCIQSWTSTIHDLVSQAGNDPVNHSNHVLDATEQYWALAHHLPKKHWNWLGCVPGVTCLPAILTLAVQCLHTFQDIAITKLTCFFVTFCLEKCASMENLSANAEVSNAVMTHAPGLVQIAYTRIENEARNIATVDYLADVLLHFVKLFPADVRQCLAQQQQQKQKQQQRTIEQQHLLDTMLLQIGSKRKFREFARRINMSCQSEVRKQQRQM